MADFGIAAALLFFVAICFCAMVHSTRMGRLTLLSWSLFSAAAVYGVGWVVVIAGTMGGANPLWEEWIAPYESIFLLHTLSATILCIGLLVGWEIANGRRGKRTPAVNYVSTLSTQVWSIGFWILLCFGVASLIVYSIPYGGIVAQLEYSSAIRSSVFEEVPDNAYSFLAPFPQLCIIACFGFYGLFLSGERRIGSALGLVLSTMISIYVIYNMQWRLMFAMFLFTFVVPLITTNNRPLKSQVMLLAGLGLVVILGLFYLSEYMQLNPADNALEFAVRELSFPFCSFFVQLEEGPNLFNGFVEVIIMPIYLLPSSLWSEWVVTSDEINTKLIMGDMKGHSGVTSQIPTDIITLGLMQMHFAGVFIIAILFGGLLRYVQKVFDNMSHRGVAAVFEANISMFLASAGLFYAQPNQIVRNNVHWLFAALCLYLLLRLARANVKAASLRNPLIGNA